ncbi:nitrilase-related carbon-nitrogen hydrolase [Marinomonas ostreistagni]|uniref:CN hydrolase domain-containing protein n=1 Tax=Marinomonas ostreistagni TaxID=359209 RepID=A0ABS0ZE33_9GAMM|nr:nitrilase-related carbon-nitrogen hydrolase [Marinomonas ostreistagni]MBJ7551643.1 hypothetical protein [Marinomonas ostreistagni]
MKITIAQLDIADHRYKENAEKVVRIIAEHAHSDIILFPELALTGFPKVNEVQNAFEHSQAALAQIAKASKAVYANVILGHIEQYEGKFYNSAYLFSNGDTSILHRKAHLWLDDVGVFQKGHQCPLVNLQGVMCGAQICFDLEFPEGSRALALAGADLILMPNGNMHPYANTHFVLTQARAIENQLFVATCNRVGTGHGGSFVGESLVVSPFGEVLMQLGAEEVIQTIEIDLKQVQKSRSEYRYIQNV